MTRASLFLLTILLLMMAFAVGCEDSEESTDECLEACGAGCPSPEYWICAEDGEYYCNDCILDCYGLEPAEDDGICEPLCEDGETKTADDGCNTCTCSDGRWACTEMACEDLEACLEDCGDGCPAPEYWVCAENGERYCNDCIVACYGLTLADDDSLCDAVCEEGETKTADDGCNTCTCSEGSWACTEMACDDLDTCLEACGDGCIPPQGLLCGTDGNLYCGTCEMACYGVNEAERSTCEVQAGTACTEEDATRFADDGCNMCTCSSGVWSCTEMACSQARNLEYSECLNNTDRSDETEIPEPYLEAEYDTETGVVHVTHHYASLNCCLGGLELDLLVEGFVVTFNYLEQFDEAGPCDCVCPTDVAFDLNNLGEGTYTIRTGTGARMTSTTVIVGDVIPPQPDATLDSLSGCLNEVNTLTSEEPVESLSAVFDSESGKIVVTHRNAQLNCCMETVTPQVAQDGFSLILTYEESYGENGPCFCMCPNDVVTRIAVSASGTYTLHAGTVSATVEVL